MDRFNSWLYKGGHPNRLARVMNRTWASVWGAGMSPPHWATLEVRGRRSGRPITLPVVIADHQDERYLVSMLGERARWVGNVRAASGAAVLIHRGREGVRLEEVAVRDRAPIIKRYLQLAPGARAHIPADHAAPLAEFERIAPQIPVFRIRVDGNQPAAAR